MKHLLILSVLSLLVWSCQKKTDHSFGQKEVDENISENNSIAFGEDLFKGKGTCSACHLADKKVIGPSIKEISAIYKEKGASISAFLREESDPIVDPEQYVVMKENFKFLKTFSDEEIKALDDYMMSF